MAEGEKTAKKKEEQSENETKAETEEDVSVPDGYGHWLTVLEQRQSEGKGTLGMKINMLRNLINHQDWKNDKYVTGSVNYGYLSIDKMKKTMAPLLAMAGLDMTPKVKIVSCQKDLGGRRSEDLHWVIRLKMVLRDLDSGEEDIAVVYGEAADSADKGLIKAQSYALKAYFATKFSLADGIDPDAVEEPAVISFKPKSKEEVAELKSKILDAASKSTVVSAPKAPAAGEMEGKPVKTVPKAPRKLKIAEKPAEKASEPVKTEEKLVETPKSDNKPAPKPEKEPETQKEVPSEAEICEKPAKKASKPVKKVEQAPVTDYKPAGPIGNAINQMIENIGNKYQEGKLSEETVKQVQDEFNSLTSDADATAFIKKYRGL